MQDFDLNCFTLCGRKSFCRNSVKQGLRFYKEEKHKGLAPLIQRMFFSFLMRIAKQSQTMSVTALRLGGLGEIIPLKKKRNTANAVFFQAMYLFSEFIADTE